MVNGQELQDEDSYHMLKEDSVDALVLQRHALEVVAEMLYGGETPAAYDGKDFPEAPWKMVGVKGQAIVEKPVVPPFLLLSSWLFGTAAPWDCAQMIETAS
jgi:hypothetical protein